MSRSEDPGGPAEPEPEVPQALAASWRTAEAQLFGSLPSSADAYRDLVAVVGDTVDRLRRLGPSMVTLLDAAPTVGDLVRDAGAARSPALRIDPEVIGRAALAVRHREVVAERASAGRVAALAAARASGSSGSSGSYWVVLEESGDGAGDLYAPYRRLEAEARSGLALLVTASPDDDFRSCRHAVQVLHVDVETGRLRESDGPDGDPVRCRSADEREARAAALKVTLGRHDDPLASHLNMSDSERHSVPLRGDTKGST